MHWLKLGETCRGGSRFYVLKNSSFVELVLLEAVNVVNLVLLKKTNFANPIF